ncbi:MAG TPA: hypothetical protein VHO50_04925 [Bacteroidales bacterium]|nr:hypothetical protein [Bacteroidales bacterium]
MKKYFLLIVAISISLTAFSQKGKVTSALSLIDQGQLDKAKTAIDEALQNEKTANWYNTFYAKGKLCQAVYKSTNPQFKELCPKPLQEAYAAYEKALSVDEKGAMKKKIITGMVYNTLAVDLYSQGSTLYEAKDYTAALEAFETQIKVSESELYASAIDTGMYFNAGLSALNSGKPDDAIKYFEKCAQLGYLGPSPYYQISSGYLAKGDTLKAETTLLELPKKFEGDKEVLLKIIDFYINSGRNAEALKYMDQAKANDPQNPVLYHVSGILNLNMNNFDVAISEIQKSIDLKSDYWDTQYAMGVAYINKAADMFTKANEIVDMNVYSKTIDEANAIYAKALPFMEKAHELKPDDVDTLERLKELYYRLKQKDASLNAKYDEVRKKIDALQNK